MVLSFYVAAFQLPRSALGDDAREYHDLLIFSEKGAFVAEKFILSKLNFLEVRATQFMHFLLSSKKILNVNLMRLNLS